MRLQQIEITGFKSFAKKSALSFDTAVTAVVGPNGSGKSNVVEAFRFVLGEQSLKSMRGKSGNDLIFRGSNNTARLSRASVSISFDNRDGVFSWAYSKNENEKDEKNLSLFDVITFTREIFADGTSKYLMNGSEIRLKHMIEVLSSVNIGASSYHIISQGEADSILRASARDRREMLEEALGLKIYHYRIKESESKLQKVTHTLEDVQSLRREIAPHLKFLSSQVQKIEKGRVIRDELESLLLQYLISEKKALGKEESEISKKNLELTNKIKELEVKLSHEAENALSQDNFLLDISKYKDKLTSLRDQRRSNENRIGRLEGMIEVERRLIVERSKDLGDDPSIVFSPVEYERVLSDLDFFITKIKSAENLEEVSETISNIEEIIAILRTKSPEQNKKEINKNSNDKQTSNIENIALELEELKRKLEPILKEESEVQNTIEILEKNREAHLEREKIINAVKYETQQTLTESKAELHILNVSQKAFLDRKENFENELKEASFLFGAQFLHSLKETEINEEINLSEIKKSIDRLKIRLDEHSGISNDVVNEYQSTVERDAFLAREVKDIENSINNLEALIIELKTLLDQKFTTGITKINEKFSEFFRIMFDGGSAFLSVTVAKKRKKKDEMEMDIEDEEDSRFLERGVEVHVNLPEKKIKELTMLSGGERSLVSIALLFAISQVNPPPFLVLDETDAALDEANSRRYGDMIERLSEYSQLIVVTHNRETMSRASVLYGVTLGNDGASKLLSIKFEEAVKVAK